jgi:hypothetical protein
MSRPWKGAPVTQNTALLDLEAQSAEKFNLPASFVLLAVGPFRVGNVAKPHGIAKVNFCLLMLYHFHRSGPRNSKNL